MQEFDVIVLGGGSGGLATAQRAAEYGARAALFEPGRLGGTCVNVGCVPKKIMWNAAALAEAVAHAPHYGFDLEVHGHDFRRLKHGREAYVRRLNDIYARNLEHKGIPCVRSKGSFVGPHEVADELGNRYRAPHIVIATGGYPRLPSVPGADLGMTSDGFFALDALPKRVAIVGSGYVAVELGGILDALGSRVSLFMRHDRLLREFDALVSERLMHSMESAGIKLERNAPIVAVRKEAALTLRTASGEEHGEFDALIWAIGRDASTATLALDRAGVATTSTGAVVVDDFQNTSTPGIYAVGDVTGKAELTPVAIAAGRRLADRVFGRQSKRKLSYEIVPSVIFSHPPIGTIGLSEQAARERYADEEVHVYVADFVPMLYALGEAKPRTAMKLVTVGPEERVVGCHVIGPGADEMTQGFAVAMTMGARKRDFDDTIAIHPTSAEELVTMR